MRKNERDCHSGSKGRLKGDMFCPSSGEVTQIVVKRADVAIEKAMSRLEISGI